MDIIRFYNGKCVFLQHSTSILECLIIEYILGPNRSSFLRQNGYFRIQKCPSFEKTKIFEAKL